MQWLFDYFSRQSKSFILAFSIALVAIICVIDYVTGTEISVLLFYILPVFISSWFIGSRAGLLLSLFSVLSWAMANNIFFQPVPSFFAPSWNVGMYLGFLIIVVYLLRLLNNSLEQERLAARYDFLTGAVSRRHFLELAESEINRARRYNRPFTAVYIDIDNFKAVNDTLGHDVGDELLVHVVVTIKDQVRTSDIVARLGGDEFMIFFPETGSEMAMAAIDKVRNVLLLAMGKNNWPVTFSFGMVTFAMPPWSVDHMIKLTDDLMYEGKKSGKNMIKHDVYQS